MAKDIVRVRPAKFPANIRLPELRHGPRQAEDDAALVIPGHASGRVTYQKLAQAEAPSDCRGFLYSPVTPRTPAWHPNVE